MNESDNALVLEALVGRKRNSRLKVEMTLFPRELRVDGGQGNWHMEYPESDDVRNYLSNNIENSTNTSIIKKMRNMFGKPQSQVKTAWGESKIVKKSMPKSGSEGRQNIFKLLFKHVEEYLTGSTLHGLRYIGDNAISIGERLFWLVAFIVAAFAAAYFISSIYAKYDLNPVIISLNPRPTPVAALPFPAITICSMNQAKKQEAFAIAENGTEVEKILLNDYCNSNNSLSNLTLTSDEGTKWENVLKFILRVNPSCQEILKVCLWRKIEMSCDDLFNSALTDDGLCCTFNALPRTFIFRNPRDMAGLNLTFPPEVDDWNPENGFSENASTNALPWRAPGAGTHLGLSLVLDAQLSTYYCSSSTGVGFKVLLHNPIETPKMADFAQLVAPGLEARIAVQPKINDASQTIRKIDIRKRMCYFMNEKDLQFFRTYTELNCKLECQANYTLSLCGCVPYYLPKNRFKKICSKKQEACSNIAKEAMEIPNQNGTNCNCLPACFELGYDGSISFGKLYNNFKVNEIFIKQQDPDYFMENSAVVHFYFTESQFTRNTKSEIYGFSEFLSNTGGLLGLFLGFSALSVVELIYYVTLKVCCKTIRARRGNKRKPKKNTIVNGAPTKLLYPYAR